MIGEHSKDLCSANILALEARFGKLLLTGNGGASLASILHVLRASLG